MLLVPLATIHAMTAGGQPPLQLKMPAAVLLAIVEQLSGVCGANIPKEGPKAAQTLWDAAVEAECA